VASSPRTPRTLRLVKAALAGTLALPSLAGCSSNHVDQHANCVDRNNVIVDDRYCDDSHYYGGGGYFIWMSSSHYGRGYSVPSGNRSYINPGDSSSRARAGLPRSGRVGGVSVHSGGVGKGSGGSGSSGSSS